MSQKDYKLEIVESLLKKHNHIRGLAKELETNQTTISRKIKELETENVIDYRQEGRNKAYFLKKTIEAQEYVFLSEHYKLLRAIEKYSSLKSIIQKIRSHPKIKLAILFGSYSKGTAHKESDIDIYIETKDSSIKQEIQALDTRLSVKAGKYDKENLLIKEIEKNHVIIKGVELYYEKNKLFG